MGKLIRFRCTVILILTLSSYYSRGQQLYTHHIDTAEVAFHNKLYLKAAQSYSKAFLLNHDRGTVSHRYYAARSWALAGRPDSAFYHLNRIAVAGYYKDLRKLSVDKAFRKLRADKRWKVMLEDIAAHGVQQDINKFQEPNFLLRALLDSILLEDERYRNLLTEAEQNYGSAAPNTQAQRRLLLQHDSINQKRVVKILNKYGWPDTEVIGESGHHALFLVLQHSPLPIRSKYLPLITAAYRKGFLEPSQIAIYTDRTDIMQGKAQTYGSQLITDTATGTSYLQPLNDPEHVDQRRAAMGLLPIKEYLKKWKINWSVQQYYNDLPKVKLLMSGQ